MLHLWIDSYSRGGLEKSFSYLIQELNSFTQAHRITIHSLNLSENYISQLALPPNVVVRYHPSRIIAYAELLNCLKNNTQVISFKNHIPLVVLSWVIQHHARLWIRHSNSILSQLRKANCAYKRDLYGSLIAYLDFFIRCSIYRLCPNHFSNCLENTMLIETFTSRACYTFFTRTPFTTCEGSAFFSKRNNLCRIAWLGRCCSSKGLDRLKQVVNLLLREGIDLHLEEDCHIDFDIITNDPRRLKNSLYPLAHSEMLRVEILPWQANVSISCYDVILFTSIYEGMSNTYLEAVSNDVSIIAPITSSGFLEFAFSRPHIYLYDQIEPNSLILALSSAIKSRHDNKSLSTRNHNSISQRLIDSNNIFLRALIE